MYIRDILTDPFKQVGTVIFASNQRKLNSKLKKMNTEINNKNKVNLRNLSLEEKADLFNGILERNLEATIHNHVINESNSIYNIEDEIDKSEFITKRPILDYKETIFNEPLREDKLYNLQVPFLARFSSKKINKHFDVMDARYESALNLYKGNILSEQRKKENAVEKLNSEIDKWEVDKDKFLRLQQEHNDFISKIIDDYNTKDKDVIEEITTLQLRQIFVPSHIKREYFLDFKKLNSHIDIDFTIPSVDSMEKIKTHRYIKSRNIIKESMYTKTEINKNYENYVFSHLISILNVVFSTLEGCVNTANVIIKLEKLDGINLANITVDKKKFNKFKFGKTVPREWFDHCGGVAGKRFSALTVVEGRND